MPTTHHESESHAVPDLAQVVRDVHEAYPHTPETHETAHYLEVAIGALGTKIIQPGEVVEMTGFELLDEVKCEQQVAIVTDLLDSERDFMNDLFAEEARAVTPDDLEALMKASDVYNNFVVGMDWSSVSVDEARTLLRTMISVEAQRTILYDVKNVKDDSHISTLNVLTYISTPLIKELYEQHNESKPSPIHTILSMNHPTEETAYTHAFILAKVYESAGGIDMVQKGENTHLDRIRPFISEVDLALLSFPEKPKNETKEGIFVHEFDLTKRIRKVFTLMEVPEEISSKFMYASRSRLKGRDENDNPTYLDTARIKERLNIFYNLVYARGIDEINEAHEKFGIVNFDNYFPEDIDSLIKLSRGDSKHIKNLQEGDVTVIFMDGDGDHNGAFNSLGNKYRKPQGRTLIFEVHSPGEFYRRMTQLKKHEVKPSTMVMAAHGTPGSTWFGQDRRTGGFRLFSDQILAGGPQAKHDEIYLDATNIKRLLSDDFMQPNRGIDSALEVEGRVQLIVDSCSGDVAFQEGIATIGEAILTQAGRTDTDVYAATGVLVSDFDTTGGTVEFYEWDEETKKMTDKNIGSKLSLEPNSETVVREHFWSNEAVKSAHLGVKRTFASYIPVKKPAEVSS